MSGLAIEQRTLDETAGTADCRGASEVLHLDAVFPERVADLPGRDA